MQCMKPSDCRDFASKDISMCCSYFLLIIKNCQIRPRCKVCFFITGLISTGASPPPPKKSGHKHRYTVFKLSE